MSRETGRRQCLFAVENDPVSGHDIICCLPWMSMHGNPMMAPAHLIASPCTPLRFTFSPVRLITCSKLLVTPWSLPVPATAPDVTHDAVDVSGHQVVRS